MIISHLLRVKPQKNLFIVGSPPRLSGQKNGYKLKEKKKRLSKVGCPLKINFFADSLRVKLTLPIPLDREVYFFFTKDIVCAFLCEF